MRTQEKPYNVWAKIMLKDKILNDCVYEGLNKVSFDSILKMLQVVCEKLDLSCPVLLETQIKHIKKFRRSSFLPSDFMESINFTRFDIELFR